MSRYPEVAAGDAPSSNSDLFDLREGASPDVPHFVLRCAQRRTLLRCALRLALSHRADVGPSQLHAFGAKQVLELAQKRFLLPHLVGRYFPLAAKSG